MWALRGLQGSLGGAGKTASSSEYGGKGNCSLGRGHGSHFVGMYLFYLLHGILNWFISPTKQPRANVLNRTLRVLAYTPFAMFVCLKAAYLDRKPRCVFKEWVPCCACVVRAVCRPGATVHAGGLCASCQLLVSWF